SAPRAAWIVLLLTVVSGFHPKMLGASPRPRDWRDSCRRSTASGRPSRAISTMPAMSVLDSTDGLFDFVWDFFRKRSTVATSDANTSRHPWLPQAHLGPV